MNEPQARSADDLPLLGEPLPIELANSLYQGEEEIDFLATPGEALFWLGHALAPLEVDAPGRLGAGELAELRGLRATIRGLLLGAIGGSPPAAPLVARLNRAAARSPCYARLRVDEAGARVVTAQSEPGLAGLLGRLAHEAVLLLGGAPGLVRRCEAEGCPMLFLKDHHRRRWCHASCGHRSRQAAYYRRKASHKRGKSR